MVEYDSRTALLVVDVQNDFADPAGSLYVKGGEDIVAVVNREIARAGDAGALVVYTQDWHPPHTPHFAEEGGVWPVHCVRDTWGAAFHPDLEVVDGPVVQKGTGGEDGYSAFSVRDPETSERSPTALERILREHDIERVVIAGLATDYCVKETGLDAMRLGFPATVIGEAVRAVDLEEGDGERALAALRDAGVHIE
jgi:nicotinamidase/pyrazinamidase